MDVSNGRIRGTLGGSLTPAKIPNGMTFSSRKSFSIKENFDNQDIRAANSISSDSLSPSNHCEVSKSTCEASKSIREASQSTCEASKSSCMAHIEDPPNRSNEVVENRLPWSEIWQLQGVSVRINKKKCELLYSWLNDTKENYHANISSSAVTEWCAATPYAKYLVEECSHDEWLLKAVELWECTEHFVEVLLDLSWSAYIMNLGARNIERSTEWKGKVDELLKSRIEQNVLAVLLYKDCNEPDKTALGAKVRATLKDRDLEVGGADHQLASLLQDRLNPNLTEWQPPFLKQHSFFIYSKFVVPLQSSSKTGAHGAILKLPWVYKKEFAVKMRHPKEDSSKTFKREFDILDKYRSPFIVGVVGYWEVESWSSWNPFINEVYQCPFLLMENLECDLNDLMGRCKTAWGKGYRGGFSDLEAIKLMLPTAKALRFLHGKCVAHRDVKPRNIMCRNAVVSKDHVGTVVNEDTIVKLIDFGEARENVSGLVREDWGRAGTLGYMDPTMWKADVQYCPFMGDVFSFAMVFAELLTWKSAQEAFAVSCSRDVQAKLAAGERPPLPESLPNYVRFIVESCWCADHLKRPDFKAICSMLQHAKILLLGMESLDELDEFFFYEDALGGVCRISDKAF